MFAASKAINLITAYPLHALVLAAVFGIVLKASKAHKRNPNGLALPPGPKGWPVIGSLFDMPRDKPWVAYHEWFKVYGELLARFVSAFHNKYLSGDMIYFEVLGQPFLILGSPRRTSDLFDKRSTNYSDRLRMPMVLEL